MRGSHTPKILFTAAALVAALCLPAAAAAQPVAEVSVGAGSITWSPAVEYERLVLTVSGAGQHFRQEFAAGDAVSFGIVTEEGLLPDGQYKWELLVVPPARDREAGAGALPRQVQSGSFRIAGGALVGAGLEEVAPTSAGPKADGGGFTEDQVILDDLIVNGSACIGLDCVNGESFGFDTLRLKENNLRVHFQDTSNSASFPTRDWRITVNDSSNGGLSHFSIDDVDGGRTPFRIEAGAPSNSLYVDDGGRIGFGTATPVAELHVKDGDTPTLRLEQDGSSGFTAQTWDVAGNESNFFVRDATNGSRLSFKIRPGALNNSIVIDPNGNIGNQAGTSPSASLHVRRTDGTAQVLIEEASTTTGNRVLLELENNGPANLRFENDSATAGTLGVWTMGVLGTGNFAFNNAAVGTGNDFVIATNGDIEAPQGTVVHTSSRTMKTNIEPVDGREVLEKLTAMPVATWRYDRGNEEEAMHLGPMAEDFYATFGLGTSERSIALSDSAGVALAAIQGLNAVVEEKDAKIAALEARLAKLEAALAALTDAQ